MTLLAMLVPAAYLPGVVSTTTMGRWGLMSLASAWFIVTLKDVTMTPSHWMGLAFLVWCAVSFFWTPSPWDTAGELLRLALLAVVFVAASGIADLGRFSSALALGVLLSAPFAVAEFLGVEPVVKYGHAISGLFGNRDMLAEIATASSILCLFRRQWILGALILALAASTGSREVPLMLLASVTFYALTQRWFLVIALAAVLACVLAYADSALAHRFSSMNMRLDIWETTILNVSLIGYGLGSYATLVPYFEFAHSEILQYAFELGAGSLFLWGVFLYATDPLRPSGQTAERATLAALFASCVVSFPLHMPATAFLIAALAGYLSGCRHRAARPEPLVRSVHFEDPAGARDPGTRPLRETDSQYFTVSDGSQPSPSAGVLSAVVQRIGDKMNKFALALIAFVLASAPALAQNAPFNSPSTTSAVQTLAAKAATLSVAACNNPNGSVQFVQVFDTTGVVTPGTTPPRMSLPLAASTATVLPLGAGFVNGIKFFGSTTATGGSSPGTPLNCVFTFRFGN